MGQCRGREVELSTVEQDSDPIVRKESKAASRGFNGLHSAVDAFTLSVGDFVAAVCQQVFQLPLNCLGDLDHRR